MHMNDLRWAAVLLVSVFSLVRVTPAAADPIEPAQRARLQALEDKIRAWAPLCESGSLGNGTCPYEDMVIFSGMMCLAGEEARCEDVRRSQGADGRWWRSPQHVDQEAENSFSRDQTLGLLSYFLATKEADLPAAQERAQRWMAWVNQNDGRLCKKTNDNRCWIDPTLWAQIGYVWTYLKLPLTAPMILGRMGESASYWIQADVNPRGYQLHLVALNLLLRRVLAERKIQFFTHQLGSTARELVKREPLNPLFRYVAEGPTYEVARQVLAQCPAQKPDAEWLEWSWCRDGSLEAWKRAMGHDCLLMIQLLQKTPR